MLEKSFFCRGKTSGKICLQIARVVVINNVLSVKIDRHRLDIVGDVNSTSTKLQQLTRNLCSHVEMYTHAGSTHHNPVTLSSDILTSESMLRSCCV